MEFDFETLVERSGANLKLMMTPPEVIKAGNISQKQYRFIETPVQKLKKAIYKAYLKESNEFRNSIYTS